MFKDSHNSLEKILFFLLAIAGILVICIYHDNEHLSTLIVTNVITMAITALATISRSDKADGVQSVKPEEKNKVEDKPNG